MYVSSARALRCGEPSCVVLPAAVRAGRGERIELAALPLSWTRGPRVSRQTRRELPEQVHIDHRVPLRLSVLSLARAVLRRAEVFGFADWPSRGCLWCNQLITRAGLQREGETAAERRAQRYVEDDEVAAPSVITLNATAAAQAVNDFLFAFTGLTKDDAPWGYWRLMPRARRVALDGPRRGEGCPHSSTAEGSVLTRGDETSLPTRERMS